VQGGPSDSKDLMAAKNDSKPPGMTIPTKQAVSEVMRYAILSRQAPETEARRAELYVASSCATARAEAALRSRV